MKHEHQTVGINLFHFLLTDITFNHVNVMRHTVFKDPSDDLYEVAHSTDVWILFQTLNSSDFIQSTNSSGDCALVQLVSNQNHYAPPSNQFHQGKQFDQQNNNYSIATLSVPSIHLFTQCYSLYFRFQTENRLKSVYFL